MLLIRKYNFFISLLFSFLLLLLALLISNENISFLHTTTLVFTNTYFGHFVEFNTGAYLALFILKTEKEKAIKSNEIKYTTIGSIVAISKINNLILINKGRYIPNTATIIINNFILPLAIVILYLGLIRERTILSNLLSGKILGLLGRTSYSFYLVHTLVIDYIATPLLLKYFSNDYNFYVIVIFILAQLIAFVIFLCMKNHLIFLSEKNSVQKRM